MRMSVMYSLKDFPMFFLKYRQKELGFIAAKEAISLRHIFLLYSLFRYAMTFSIFLSLSSEDKKAV